MQSFTLAQIERAIHHWRQQHDRARLYHTVRTARAKSSS
jgi:hypothetical protein